MLLPFLYQHNSIFILDPRTRKNHGFIQSVAHIGGILKIQKLLRVNPLGNQHLYNFDAAHDLTKASTTHIKHKEAPQRMKVHI